MSIRHRTLVATLAALMSAPPLSACEECKAFAVQSLQAAAAVSAVKNWSDPATWGGTLPQAGQDVTVPAGVTIRLDTSTPVLGGLLINGALVFDDSADRALSAQWIAVMGAGSRLEVGTEAQPFTKKATITLHGTDEAKNVFGTAPLTSGNKFVMVEKGGVIDLHGASRSKKSWTVLAANQAAGATVITVADATGWQPGDRLGFAAGDGHPDHLEERTVSSISADGKTVTLNAALAWPRSGVMRDLGGAAIDTRCEVALLSHRIVVQGAPDSDASQFGMHGMVMPGGIARIEGVEFARAGQLGLKARYPWHWHLVDRLPSDGVTGQGQYIRDCSVHRSFHRAYVIHGTNDVQVARCVAFDVRSHAYVMGEDGDEVANVGIDNLAVGIRMVETADLAFPRPGDNIHPSLQNEHRSAGFWMSTANQVLVGNRVANTSGGIGYFYDINFLQARAQPIPARVAQVFQGNLVHNVTLRDEDGNARPEITPSYIGAATLIGVFDNGLLGPVNAPGTQAVLRGTTAYDCNLAFWMERNHVLRDTRIADASKGILTRSGTHADTRIGYRAHLDAPWLGVRPANTGIAGIWFEDTVDDGFGLLGLRLFGAAAAVLVFSDEDFSFGNPVRARSVQTSAGWAKRTLGDNTSTPDSGALIDEDGSLTGRNVPTTVRLVNSAGAIAKDATYWTNAGAFTPINQPPTAVAGSDRVLTLPSGTLTMNVALSATGSSDSDGTISSYAWSVNGRPLANGSSTTATLPAGEHIACVRVTDNQNGVDQHAVRIRIIGSGGGVTPPPTGLPTGWTAAAIGNAPTGSVAYDSATARWTVAGSGADIWGTNDAFRFTWQELTGDGAISARVVSQTNTNVWAKAGVMLRDGGVANARHAMTVVTPGKGVAFQRRVTTGGTTAGTAGSTALAPRWVRVGRSGATVTGQESADGSTWTLIGSATIAFPAAVRAGLCVTSHNTGAVSTAVFEQVQVTPAGGG